MRYGIIVYRRKGVINIGDDMQLLAIKELYERIGISYDELIKIDFYDLTTYDGEEVILPICFPFFGYNETGCITNFTPKIKPVFLSLALFYTHLNNIDSDYFKSNHPVGCRDEHTCSGLRKQGIDAYLNGCMTLTLGKRITGKGNKVYCVDVYDEFIPYVYSNCHGEIVFKSHIFYEHDEDTMKLADSLLEEYAQNAKLIITSRLHCALPCLAIGVPVLFINNCYDNRFTWLEDIIHVYTPKEWDNIDWDVKPKNIEYFKKIMRSIASKRMLGDFPATDIKLLEDIYSKREKRDYVLEGERYIKRWLDANWGSEDIYREYVVWGVSQFTSLLVDYISNRYKNAVLTDVIDSYKKMSYLGCETKKPDEIKGIEKKYLFVCALAASKAAKEFVSNKKMIGGGVCILSSKGIL